MALINKNKVELARKLIRAAFGRYKSKFVLITILGFLSGLFEGIGISIVIPLFSIMTKQETGADFISNTIRKFFDLFNVPLTPIFLLLLIVILFSLKGFVQFVTRYTNAKTVAEFGENTRKELLKSILQSKWQHLLNQKSGHLEGILLYDVERSAYMLSLLSNIILILTGFIMYAFVAFNISAPITALTVIFGIGMFFIIKPIFYRSRQLALETSKAQKDLSHHASENFLGIKIIKASGAEDQVFQKGKTNFSRIKEAAVKTSFYRQSSIALIEPLTFVLIAAIFIFSYKSPAFNLASFVVVMYLIQKMFNFVKDLQSQVQSLNEALPYLKTVLDYKLTVSENRETDDGTENFKFNDLIEFKNVNFSYEADKEILSNLNFTIKKGEIIGLIGESGSGKTTVTDLLLHLFKPTSGEILIDKKNIDSIKLSDWRKNISYVPQDIFLLNDTIENNIKFYDDSVLEKNIIEAAKIANIYDFIRELPEKFKTEVGERGIKLSGGQRQRIVLARALARKPEILILDEATSAIDTESEALIQNSISNLRGKMTIFVIAHRLSTILNSDRLLVLENGRIIEEGNPKQLLESKDSHFYKIYNIEGKTNNKTV
jgi:ABC-type multidrug transport system fused ATPase/permease subunit